MFIILNDPLDEAMGTPPGGGLLGLYQSCCIFTLGLKIVLEKVAGAPELHVTA